MTALLTVSGIVAICVALLWWQLHKAYSQIEQLMNDNANLEQQNAVMSVQVKNARVRKENEENSRHIDRASVIDQLQQSGDLRD